MPQTMNMKDNRKDAREKPMSTAVGDTKKDSDKFATAKTCSVCGHVHNVDGTCDECDCKERVF